MNSEKKMMATIEALKSKLVTIRAGRANPAMLNGIMVSCYGMPTPIQSVANITVPEARKLFVKPFDRSTLKDIERAINEANLGIAPTNNGEMIIASELILDNCGIDNKGVMTINEAVEFSGKIDNETKEAASPVVINVDGTWKDAKGENRGTIKVATTGSIVAAANNGIKNGTKRLFNNQGVLIYRASIENAGVINGIVNGFSDGQENALIVMMDKNARLMTAQGSTGEIDNTICSEYVKKQDAETIFCEISGETSATDLAELTLNSNAKRLDILNGTTITIPSGKDGEVSDITVSIEKVSVKGNLTISGAKNTLRFMTTTGANMEIAAGTTTIAAQTIVALGKASNARGTLSIDNGKLIISANAKLYAGGQTSAPANKVENYGEWLN